MYFISHYFYCPSGFLCPRGFRSGLLEQGGGCVGGLFAAVYWQEAGLGRDENGVGVKLLNDEMQCVDFGCGCGVELNRFLQ